MLLFRDLEPKRASFTYWIESMYILAALLALALGCGTRFRMGDSEVAVPVSS